MRCLLLAAALLAPGAAFAQSAPHAMPGEIAVDPYVPSNANAGAAPFKGDGMAKAFGGQDGIRRVVDRFVTSNFADPQIGEVFQGHDQVRLKRVIFEQFCYILNAGCEYSGRDMKASHRFMGVQQKDMNKVVQNLQKAMAAEKVPFDAQNRFLAKLAPMRKDVVDR